MNRFKEVISFIVCLIVILTAAYFTGFLDDLSINGFKKAYYSFSSNVSKNISKNKIKLETESKTKKSSSYKNYRISNIPKNIISDSTTTNSWSDIFSSDKKVVFFIYDTSNKSQTYTYDFFVKVNNYVVNNNLYTKYKYLPTTLENFKNHSVGGTGPEKICNSFDECNEQRKKAVAHTNVVNFLEHCGKTICIINPYKHQYVTLKQREATSATKLIKELANW